MKRHLGLISREIAALGLGCFGLSEAYGPVDSDEATDTIRHALDLGCTLLDTADIYGAGENERLVGLAIAGRRDEVVLATKGGFVCDAAGKVTGRDGSPAHLRGAVEASLKRLGVEVIDLYTLHRVDPAVPIEDSVGAVADLVREGKVRTLGLSEVTAAELRRAHAVHPISALQSEYSLWNREPEREVMPLCRELGIAFVAYSPLGRGLFSGSLQPSSFAEEDFRRNLPRFEAERMETTTKLISWLKAFAEDAHLTPSQAALAWILHKDDNVFAIPGTRRRRHLDENVAALTVQLTSTQVEALDTLFAADLDFGSRYSQTSVFAPQPVRH